MSGTGPHHVVREDWLALAREDVIAPGQPILDAHHHLWDRPEGRYRAAEFRGDVEDGLFPSVANGKTSTECRSAPTSVPAQLSEQGAHIRRIQCPASFKFSAQLPSNRAPSGRVNKAGLFLQFSGGRAGPDGLALTASNGVVVCQTGMGLVWVHDSLGRAIAVIRSPRGLGTTNCAFGGPEGRTLFITESDSGSILKAEFPPELDIVGAPMFAHGNDQSKTTT